MNTSEEIIEFLLKRGWEISKKSDHFYYLLPPKKYVGDRPFILNLPRQINSPDYNEIIERVLVLLFKLYPHSINHPRSLLKKFYEKNSNQKRKYLAKAEWIEPEFKSRVSKISIHDIYIPTNL